MSRLYRLISAPRRLTCWLWLLSLLLTGLGACLWLIHRFGTPLPIWDQWEEARVVIAPWFEGKLSLANLFEPHNEHRLLCTRLYALALVLLNHQWDNQVEMVGDAIIHCATLGWLGWLMSGWLETRSYWLIWLPLILVLVLPFGWENSLAGFQSQFYFLLLFSLLTLWLLGLHPPNSARWWWGVATAILALFTVASGFLAAAAVFALAFLRAARRPQTWKKEAPTLAFCTAVILAGLLLKADVRHHHVLQAHTPMEFLLSLGANLAWPWIVVPPFAVLNLLPLAALAWVVLKNPAERHPAGQMTLVIGIWAVLQGMAAAYARGAEGKPPGWRYMDSSSFILVANCFSIAVLTTRPAAITRFKALWYSGFAFWGAICLAGLALLNLRAWQIDIPERALYQRAQMQNMRAYMATGDLRAFDKPNPYLPLYEGDPYAPHPRHPGEKLVTKYLSNPWIRTLLPACVRDPLPVVPETMSGFETNGSAAVRPKIPGEISWGSYTKDGAAATGRFESMPVPPSRFPFLEFRVAGDLGKPGLSLTLLDLSSGKSVAVKPLRPPGKRWQNIQVRTPRGEFRIIATDRSRDGWFAFQAPRGMGWLSWAAERMTAFGASLFFAGLGLCVISLVFTFYSGPASKPPASASPST